MSNYETDIEKLMKILDRPIAFQRCFVTISGSVTAAVMLSQAVYWTQRTAKDSGGWFYKTQQEWEMETGLSRSEQETARKKLKAIGVIEEKKEGIPCKLFFRVNSKALYSSLLNPCSPDQRKPTNQNAGIPQTGAEDYGKPVCRNPADNLYTENTTKITTETTYKENTPLTPQGEFVAVEVPFSDWLPENPENPEQVETPPTSQDFQEPLSLAKSSGVETISPAAAKKSKPSDADFNIFCDRWNEQKGTWSGCELSRTTETFSTKRLNGFRKAWQEHGDRLMEKFDLACEFIRTNQWHRDNPFSIDTLLVTGNITKYADNAIKARNNPQVKSKSTKDLSEAELYTEIVAKYTADKAAKLTQSVGAA